MRYNQKNKKTSIQHSRKPWIVGLIILCIIATCAAAYLYTHKKHSNNVQTKITSSQKDKQESDTPKKTSEGQTFPVPSDLPKTAIKEYVLVKETDEYKIRRMDGTNKYTITLYAIINNPSQYDMYKEQLKEFKQKALDYLKGQGIDVNTIEATYEPDEATNL